MSLTQYSMFSDQSSKWQYNSYTTLGNELK